MREREGEREYTVVLIPHESCIAEMIMPLILWSMWYHIALQVISGISYHGKPIKSYHFEYAQYLKTRFHVTNREKGQHNHISKEKGRI